MKRVSLQDYVKSVGQKKAANVFNISQYAISKAINSNRKIFVYQDGDLISAIEERKFPVKANSQSEDD